MVRGDCAWVNGNCLQEHLNSQRVRYHQVPQYRTMFAKACYIALDTKVTMVVHGHFDHAWGCSALMKMSTMRLSSTTRVRAKRVLNYQQRISKSEDACRSIQMPHRDAGRPVIVVKFLDSIPKSKKIMRCGYCASLENVWPCCRTSACWSIQSLDTNTNLSISVAGRLQHCSG